MLNITNLIILKYLLDIYNFSIAKVKKGFNCFNDQISSFFYIFNLAIIFLAATIPERYAPLTVDLKVLYVCSPQKYKFRSSIGLAIFSHCSMLVYNPGNEYDPPKLGSVLQKDRIISKSSLEIGEVLKTESLFAIRAFSQNYGII